MKNFIKWFGIISLVALVVTSCENKNFTEENYNKIQSGMTTAQVFDILGKPYSVTYNDDGVSFCVWVNRPYIGIKNLSVWFDKDSKVLLKVSKDWGPTPEAE